MQEHQSPLCIRNNNICFALQGSVCFILGLFFIFVRWPVVGIILEIYSCVVLFGLVSSSSENSFGSVCIYMLVHCTFTHNNCSGNRNFCFSNSKKRRRRRRRCFVDSSFSCSPQGFLAICEGISLSDTIYRMDSAISHHGEFCFITFSL